jgi:hypothetical protein
MTVPVPINLVPFTVAIRLSELKMDVDRGGIVDR